MSLTLHYLTNLNISRSMINDSFKIEPSRFSQNIINLVLAPSVILRLTI